MIATKEEEKARLRAAGKLLAEVLNEMAGLAREGMSAAELDLAAERSIRAGGGVPAFLGYQPAGAIYPYPATLCVSVGDEVVHGLPSEDKIFSKGDVVKLDLGLSLKGCFVDAARTVCIGACDESAKKLLAATREALDAAVAAARAGAHTGDIGAAIERVAKKYKLGIVKDLGGHAVGAAVHEKPYIGNEGRVGEGEELVEGMVLALEPMLCEGKGDIVVAKDDWTICMRDGSRAAQFEKTILVTRVAAEVLTPW